MVTKEELLKRWSETAHRASCYIEHITWGLIRNQNGDFCIYDYRKYFNRLESLVRQLEDLSKDFLKDSAGLY